MDPSRLAEIERCALDLAGAAKSLADYCRQASDTGRDASAGMSTSESAHRARRAVLNHIAKLRSLAEEPKDFLQHLASQTQLLACIHWLGEFQVLACIPLKGSVPAQDVAALTGVPESVLIRVVRMASTAGFLSEPHALHVAHTPLSAGFVTEPRFADAASFLAGSLAPAALHMAATTRRYGEPAAPEQSAFCQAQKDPVPLAFPAACEQQPRLQRQWVAYRRSSADPHDGDVAEALSRLDWGRLGSACIVEAVAPLGKNNPYESHPSTMARHLAERYGSQVEITIQLLSGPSDSPLHVAAAPPVPPLSGAILQRRFAGQPQNIRHAALYVLHWAYLLSPTLTESHVVTLKAELTAELQAHLSIMRENRATTLIVAMPLLPDAGSVDASVEAVARVHDLALLQLANSTMLQVGEMVDLIQSVEGGGGRLQVVSRAKAGATNEVVALGVKFQAL